MGVEGGIGEEGMTMKRRMMRAFSACLAEA